MTAELDVLTVDTVAIVSEAPVAGPSPWESVMPALGSALALVMLGFVARSVAKSGILGG